MSNGLGWRPEDDKDLEEGWTWRKTCECCNGPMAIEDIERGERFCTDGCESLNDSDDDDDEASA